MQTKFTTLYAAYKTAIISTYKAAFETAYWAAKQPTGFLSIRAANNSTYLLAIQAAIKTSIKSAQYSTQ
jgi:hypothetical protein